MAAAVKRQAVVGAECNDKLEWMTEVSVLVRFYVLILRMTLVYNQSFCHVLLLGVHVPNKAALRRCSYRNCMTLICSGSSYVFQLRGIGLTTLEVFSRHCKYTWITLYGYNVIIIMVLGEVRF